MRTLFWGAFVGLAFTAICGGLLSMTGGLPIVQKIVIALMVGASSALMIWSVGLVIGVIRRLGSGGSRAADRDGDRPPLRLQRTRSTPDSIDRAPKAAPKSAARHPALSPEAAEALGRSEAAVLAGDFRGAADLLSDYLDGYPDDVEAHLARGRIFLDLSDYNRSMSDFLTAEEAAPESPEPQVAIGDLYFARKDYERAIEYFDAALALDPNHPMAHCRRGLSHYYRKNHADALRDLERAQRLDPDIPNLKTHLAMARKATDGRARRR